MSTEAAHAGGGDGPRIAFAGTPDFAVPALEALVAHGFPPSRVYTQPDRPSGRGRRIQASPVKEAAQRHGLPVHQPERLGDDDAALLADCELLVVVAYGQILPRAVLEAPRRGCVNVHASLLPRWRGAAPIQRAILAGDEISGVTLMQMSEGLDCGPILAARRTPIRPEETAGELHDRLAHLGAELLVECMNALLSGALTGTPQDDAKATYAEKIARTETLLDPGQPATALERRVRAFEPAPGARLALGDHDVRVRRAGAVAEPAPPDAPPGAVVAAGPEGIRIATGEGQLRIDRLQPAGGRTQSAGAFLNGHRLALHDPKG